MAQYRLYQALSMPANSTGDHTPLTAGLQFQVTTRVRLMAILWWQATTNISTAPRSVGLWSTTNGIGGTLQGTLTTAAPVGTGWQTVTLDTPIIMEPGSYVAAVHHPAGDYSAINSYYTSGGGQNNLTVNQIIVPNLTNALNEKQNAYIYEPYFAFPDGEFGGSMYGVDILVDNVIPPPTDLHVYDGSTWRGGSLYVYDGADWVSSEVA
jgi:hypothetical protein